MAPLPGIKQYSFGNRVINLYMSFWSNNVFGEGFINFLMKEDMDMIISSKEVSDNCIIFYIWLENFCFFFFFLST